MPRSPSTQGLSLAQLERLMRTRRSEMAKLSRQREKLQKRLDGVDSRIADISGGAGGGRPGSRAPHSGSLQETILQVLGKARGPIKGGDILEKGAYNGQRP